MPSNISLVGKWRNSAKSPSRRNLNQCPDYFAAHEGGRANSTTAKGTNTFNKTLEPLVWIPEHGADDHHYSWYWLSSSTDSRHRGRDEWEIQREVLAIIWLSHASVRALIALCIAPVLRISITAASITHHTIRPRS